FPRLRRVRSRTTRVIASAAPAAQTSLRLARGSTVAAEASAPTCMAWSDGKASRGFPNRGHPMQMAAHGQAVRPPLVKDRLEEMRSEADGQRRQQDVIAVPAVGNGAAAAIHPPTGGDRQLRRPLGARAGVFSDRTCDSDDAAA